MISGLWEHRARLPFESHGAPGALRKESVLAGTSPAGLIKPSVLCCLVPPHEKTIAALQTPWRTVYSAAFFFIRAVRGKGVQGRRRHSVVGLNTPPERDESRPWSGLIRGKMLQQGCPSCIRGPRSGPQCPSGHVLSLFRNRPEAV